MLLMSPFQGFLYDSAPNPATNPAPNPATNPAPNPATNPAPNPATNPATNPAPNPAKLHQKTKKQSRTTPDLLFIKL
jgi:hypothetical protein